MKDVTIGNFKAMSADDVANGASFRITSDGKFIAFVIVPPSVAKKEQFEALAGQCNKAMGFKD